MEVSGHGCLVCVCVCEGSTSQNVANVPGNVLAGMDPARREKSLSDLFGVNILKKFFLTTLFSLHILEGKMISRKQDASDGFEIPTLPNTRVTPRHFVF